MMVCIFIDIYMCLLFLQINRLVHDHITHADMTASDVAETWQLIAEEGDMKVYKREQEEDGMIVDPIKAVHTVHVSRVVLCHGFGGGGG